MSYSRRGLRALGWTMLGLAAGTGSAHAQPIETIIQDDALMLHGSSESEIRLGMQRARAVGIDRLRLTAGWSVIAPHPDTPVKPDFDATDPAAYPDDSWDELDRAVRLAHETGLRPMIDIAFWAPRWATTEPEINERAAQEIDPGHFADFARAVARRYSGTWAPPATSPSPPAQDPPPDPSPLDELFGREPEPSVQEPAGEPKAPAPLPAVDTFTLWNEPNHAGFLRPQWIKVDGQWVPRAADIYRAMVRLAYPMVKEVAPHARVLIGATASMGSSTPGSGNVPPLRFLRALACVDEELQPLTTGSCAGFARLPGDGWSHHPYSLRTTPDVDTKDPDKLPVAGTGRLAATLRALVAIGRVDPGVADLYLTEYGYETNRPDPNAPFTLDQQAGLLAWAEQIATSQPSVRSWPQFQLYDRPDDPPRAGMRPFSDWHSGLFFSDGSPKPSAAQYGAPVHAACARRKGRRWALIWGRLRGRHGIATVERRFGTGAWRRIGIAVRPRSTGAAVRVQVRHRAGTTYRLRWEQEGSERVTSAIAPRGACSSLRRARKAARAKPRSARRRS